MQDEMKDFLKENGLDPAGIDREGLLDAFLREMDAGLRGAPSSLQMIPSFIDPDAPVKTETPVVVLDAGGTNLRTAVVSIGKDGKAEIGSFVRGLMPGSKGEISENEFYDTFARFLEPVVASADSIGFCFSYPAEILPDCDARLLKWTKQIEVPSVVGTLIGTGLKRHLAKLGHNRRVVILNDTVATLLAGKSVGVSRPYSAYVGFILGTGTNTAYAEKTENIVKRNGLKPGATMAINVESGAFKGQPQSRFDAMMDAATIDPGCYTFEKMISGAYLGRIGYTILCEAAGAGILSAGAGDAVRSWTTVANKQLDDFCGGVPEADNPFLDAAFTAQDAERVIQLCTPVYVRAAILTAVNIASAICKTGEGRDPARPVCVNIDGSTYHRTRTAQFRSLVQAELQKLLEPRGLHYDLIRVDESPVIGAAVAGLM
ncbi:MAG: hexokinase [Kiritimatiellae bacterium]|nr:hexokinase [Kiritimatiellia bacterium]